MRLQEFNQELLDSVPDAQTKIDWIVNVLKLKYNNNNSNYNYNNRNRNGDGGRSENIGATGGGEGDNWRPRSDTNQSQRKRAQDDNSAGDGIWRRRTNTNTQLEPQERMSSFVHSGGQPNRNKPTQDHQKSEAAEDMNWRAGKNRNVVMASDVDLKITISSKQETYEPK